MFSIRLGEQPLISQADLNIDDKIRSNYFPWRGQFSPQLVESHLRTYTKGTATILDPFVGSGTVLLESARLGHAAFGAELNPAPATLARTYALINQPRPVREQLIINLKQLINDLDSYQDLPLLSNVFDPRDLRNTILQIWRGLSDGHLIHLVETLIVLLDYNSGPVSINRLLSTLDRLIIIIRELPYSQFPVQIFLSDARAIPLPDDTIDMVFTSPPYINVFNYHQVYRKSVEAIHWDVLSLAKSEIGSNRKNRANRFLTVVQYCLDISQVLYELTRLCRPKARAIFIVGRESNVRKTPFYNGQILAEIASYCFGIPLSLIQERIFKNRYGRQIREDIIHLEMDKVTGNQFLSRAREVAVRTLRKAEERVPTESAIDLEDAILWANTVQPSPLAQPTRHF